MSLTLLSPWEMAKRRYGSGSIRKRAKTYEIGYRIKGRQVWELTNTDDAETAETLLQSRLLEIRQGKEDQLLGTRFEDLSERWLRNKANEGVRIRTLELWESIVRTSLNPAFGKDYVHQVNNVSALEDYRDNKIKGNLVPVAGAAHAGPLSPQTVSHHFTVLRQILDYAMVLDLIDVNKAKLVKKPRIQKPLIEPVDSADVKKLLGELDTNDRALVLVLVSCGLRIGEATGLRIQDFDAKKNLLKVRGSIKTKGTKHYRDDYPKNAAGNRTLHISDTLADEIKKQIKRINNWPDPDNLKLIFPNRAGRPMSRSNFRRRVFKPAAQRAGLVPTDDEARNLRKQGKPVKVLRLHDLRHTFASELLSSGVPGFVVQKRGGWANPQSMARYGHLVPSDVEDADTSNLYS